MNISDINSKLNKDTIINLEKAVYSHIANTKGQGLYLHDIIQRMYASQQFEAYHIRLIIQHMIVNNKIVPNEDLRFKKAISNDE